MRFFYVLSIGLCFLLFVRNLNAMDGMNDDSKRIYSVDEQDETQEALRLIRRAIAAENALLDEMVLAIKRAIREGMTRVQMAAYVQKRIKKCIGKVDKTLEKLPTDIQCRILDCCSMVNWNEYFTKKLFGTIEACLSDCKKVRREIRRELGRFYMSLFAPDEDPEDDNEDDLRAYGVSAQIYDEQTDDDLVRRLEYF
jgi:hypothetical protein